MQSKGNAPTAVQKRWREAVRAMGSVITGDDAVIHHCVGATGSHNKVKIGHWWIIPLTNEEHLGLHDGDTFGSDSRKAFEKEAFRDVCTFVGVDDIPPLDVREAIEGYHR